MNSRAYILDYQIFYIIIKYFFSRTILNQKKKQFHINFLKSKSTFGLKKKSCKFKFASEVRKPLRFKHG